MKTTFFTRRVRDIPDDFATNVLKVTESDLPSFLGKEDANSIKLNRLLSAHPRDYCIVLKSSHDWYFFTVRFHKYGEKKNHFELIVSQLADDDREAPQIAKNVFSVALEKSLFGLQRAAALAIGKTYGNCAIEYCSPVIRYIYEKGVNG